MLGQIPKKVGELGTKLDNVMKMETSVNILLSEKPTSTNHEPFGTYVSGGSFLWYLILLDSLQYWLHWRSCCRA